MMTYWFVCGVHPAVTEGVKARNRSEACKAMKARGWTYVSSPSRGGWYCPKGPTQDSKP